MEISPWLEVKVNKLYARACRRRCRTAHVVMPVIEAAVRQTTGPGEIARACARVSCQGWLTEDRPEGGTQLICGLRTQISLQDADAVEVATVTSGPDGIKVSESGSRQPR